MPERLGPIALEHGLSRLGYPPACLPDSSTQIGGLGFIVNFPVLKGL